MQELEKILEEIEKGTHTFELLGRDVDFVAIDWVRDIISKYRNEDNEMVEQCPYCENEVALHWNVEEDGYQIFCPNCGKPMMLCSMCDARDGAVCDWKEGEGCKHSDERYRDYFRKHLNDGWISVEDRLPEDDVDVLVTYADIDDEEYADITITTYGNAYLGGNKLDFKEWRSPFEYFKSNYKVMAWQYLPEPYHPERSVH